MTANQIAYLSQIELARSNVAREAETKRHNIESLNETIRSNKANEQERFRYNTLYLSELQRSNMAKESLNRSQLEENKRHNLFQEAYNSASLKIEKYKADNALYLGLGNLATTREYNLAQSELAQERVRTEMSQQGKNRAETELFGIRKDEIKANIREKQTQADYNIERSTTEKTLRNSQKYQNYSNIFRNTVGTIVEGASKLIPLFGG